MRFIAFPQVCLSGFLRRALPAFAAGTCWAQNPLFTTQAVYLNGGTGPQEFPALKDMRSAWGDIDGDGDYDLVLMGTGTSGPVTKLYENVSDATHPFAFRERTTSLPQLQDGALAWGDLDNDGDLDLAITGSVSAAAAPGDLRAAVYRNDGPDGASGWRLTLLATPLTPCRWGTVSWGDVDNDGDADLFISGNTSPDSVFVSQRTRYSRLHINERGFLTSSGQRFLAPRGLAAETAGNEPGPLDGSLTQHVTWADVNKDSFMDLILTTDDDGPPVHSLHTNPGWGDYRVEVWINRPGTSGLAVFEKLGASLARSGSGGFDAWGHHWVHGDAGDWDADGWTDIAFLSGWKVFPEPDWDPIQFSGSSVALHSNGTNSVTDVLPGFTGHPTTAYGGIFAHTAADVLNSGAQIWLGNAELELKLLGDNGAYGLHETTTQTTVPARFLGVLDAVDVDGNGTLDLFHSGFEEFDGQGDGRNLQTLLYRNNFSSNTRPLPPQGLVAEDITPNSVHFRWDPAVDQFPPGVNTKTPSAALRYALSLRKTDGNYYVRMGHDLTGHRLTPGLNGTLQTTDFHFKMAPGQSLPDGTYRWSVQAIDSGGLGSELAFREFTVAFGNPPDQVESGLPFRDTAMDLGDQDKDGALDVVLAGSGADASVLGVPTVVWKNGGTGFIAGPSLPPLRRGAVCWGDADGDGDLDLAFSGDSNGQPVTRIYQNDAGILMPRHLLRGLTQSALAWGDFDNDGDLDLIVTGYADKKPATLLYRNGGEKNDQPGTFGLMPATLLNIGSGAAAWGDFDGDGDLDLLLCGDTMDYDIPVVPVTAPPFNQRPPNTYYMAANPGAPPPVPVTILYRSDGLNTSGPNAGKWQFTEIPAGLPLVLSSSIVTARAEWCDFNADGRPDLVLGGTASIPGHPGYGQPSVKVFLNPGPALPLGQWPFTAGPELLTGAISRALQTVTCADWDNDGRPDVLLSGRLNSVGNVPTQIVHNENLSFTRHSFLRSVVGNDQEFASGLAAFGHFDGDHNADVISSAMWGIRSTVFHAQGRAGVQAGSSSLIGSLDYSDTFTADSAGTNVNRPLSPVLPLPAGYAVEQTHGHPAISFESNPPFGFASDDPSGRDLDAGSVGYPFYQAPNASGAGSYAGCTETFGRNMDYGLHYGSLRPEFVVQVDAVQPSVGFRITSGIGIGPGAQSASVLFRGDGSESVALTNGVAEHTISGIKSGIKGPGEWYNYAVRFNRPGNILEIFVNQVSVGSVNLHGFANSNFQDFSTAFVSVGGTTLDYSIQGDGGRFWTDNFQVGAYSLSPLPEQSSTWGTVGTLFSNPAPAVTPVNIPENAPPSVPVGLIATVHGQDVTLSWQPSTDDHTPAAGLTYNLSVVRTNGQPGGMPGMADEATGRRLVCRPGNAGHHTSWTLHDLPTGTYRWSVQAIDASLTPSGFAPAAQTFTTNPPVPPVITPLPPLHVWTVGHPAPAAIDFLGVAAGRSARIVAGRRGRLVLSRNRDPFAEVDSGVFTDLYDVIIDPAGATAVGQAGVIRTSSDGIIWRESPSGVTATLRAVVRGGTGWVTAGDNVILHSTDRLLWTPGTMPAGTNVYCLTWDMGRYVAAGERAGQEVLLTSPNGTSWTDVTPAGLQAGKITGIASDGAKFVAVGGSAPFPGAHADVLTSTNGQTWTFTQEAGASPMLKIVHSPDGWFAVNESQVMRSASATAWTSVWQGSFIPPNFAALAVDANIITAAGAGGGLFESSVSSLSPGSWTRLGGNSLNSYGRELTSVASLGNIVVAVGEGGLQYVSLDGGKTWAGAAFLVGDGFYGVASGAGRIVRTYYQGIDSTADGITWDKVPLTRPRAIAFGNGRFVATRDFGGFYVSTNGQAWNPSGTGTPEASTIAFGNGVFMVLDAAGSVRVSTDGSSWSVAGQVTAKRLCFAYDRFFAISDSGLDVRSSTDGAAWQPVVMPFGAIVSQIIRHGDRFVAIGGPDGMLLTSPDTVTWTSIPIPASGLLNTALSTSNGLLIAGAGHALLLAPDTSQPSPPVTTSLSIAGNPSPGVFLFTVTGRAGQLVTIERSQDLNTWISIASFTLSGGTESLEVQIPNPAPADYFRLRWTP